MLRELTSQKLPIKMWLYDIESSAIDQTKNLANLPSTVHHVALMPDAHTGKGMPIGGVIACKNAIIVNAVGADIACGVCSLKTSLTDISEEQLKAIRPLLRERIPVGRNSHKTGYKAALHINADA